MSKKIENKNTTATKSKLKIRNLTLEDVDRIMARLGPCEDLTHEELLKLSEEKLQGRKVSDIIREERDEGY